MSDEKDLKKDRKRRKRNLEESFQRARDAKRIDDVDAFVFDLNDRIHMLASLHKDGPVQRWSVKKAYSFD